MIGILTGIALAAGFAQFAFYCRSALAAFRGTEVSDRVRNLAGVDGRRPTPDDFKRFSELARLCPEQRATQRDMRAIEVYFGLLRLIGRASGRLIPAVAAWAIGEQQACSQFAAAVLERRISSSRHRSLRHSEDIH
jgi:hypothetical protein